MRGEKVTEEMGSVGFWASSNWLDMLTVAATDTELDVWESSRCSSSTKHG